MELSPEESRPGTRRASAALLVSAVWVGLLALAFFLPPDGREHGNLPQFLGRLHPLLVHGPVALLALVPLMELAGLGTRWAYLRPAAGWILALAAAAAFVAAFDGWLLAWSGGYRGHDVTRHMWGGVFLAAAAAAALETRVAGARATYVLLLAATFGLMVWTSHGGGAISHGEDFLTAKMPARVRAWLGIPPLVPAPSQAAAPPAAASLRAGPGSVDPASPAYFAVHVAPLLGRSCVSCHKAEKHKGGLRMDSYEELMRGGTDGPVVVPGSPKTSEILRRVRLPLSDDDSMPSDGDKPLTPEEIQTLEHWIAAGAKSG